LGISDIAGIIAAEVFVEYDTDVLTVFSAPQSPTSSSGTLTAGWSVQANTEPGVGSLETLKIAVATDQSGATGPQTLIEVNFTVNDVSPSQRVPASSVLNLTHVLLNDGNPPNIKVNGLVTLTGNDGTIGSLPAQFIPREDLTVTVVDADEDLDGVPNTDQVPVTATNLNNGDVVNLTLSEDAVTAGTFSATVTTVFGTAASAGGGRLQAQAGDVIEFSFSDALDGAGAGPFVRTAQSTAIGGADGSVAMTLVSQPGDPLYIEVTDADLNTSFSSAQTASVTVENSRTLESFTVVLTEVDVDDDVFFGNLPTIPGASTATEMNTAEDDVVTVTYDDVVTLVGDQQDRTATDDVIDPWGDADDNESLQAFDAAQVLFDVLSGGTHLSPNGRLAADVADAFGAVTPYDAAFILQKRVGLISTFPVQDPASANHPQGTPVSPKALPQVRSLALHAGDGYWSLWAEDRSEVLSGDLLIEGLDGQVAMGEALTSYLVASRSTAEGLRIVFAGAEAVDGPGELLRIAGPTTGSVQLREAAFNDGSIVAWTAAVATEASMPAAFALHANAPNPFNPETTLRFDLAESVEVRLEIYDALGQKVRTLVAESMPAGAHQVLWRGVDERGQQVSSGVYFYRLQAGDFTQLRSMLLLK